MKVVIGAPICRQTSYAVDKFISNQREIQRSYLSSELVLATSEGGFIDELRKYIESLRLRATVLQYNINKPDYARSHVWNIACGREVIRQYTLSRTEARYLLFLDADMVFHPSVVATMERAMDGYDVVFSGYPLRQGGMGLAGGGCVMLTRDTLEQLEFRCFEFKNGEVMFEDTVLEVDLYRLGSHVRKGFFVPITHYITPTEARYVTPHSLGIARKIANSTFIRRALIETSIVIHHNIPWKLKLVLIALTSVFGSRSRGQRHSL